MDENKRYRLFKLFLIFTILNIFGIFVYENISQSGLFKKRPEFYIESIKPEPEGESEGENENNNEIEGSHKAAANDILPERKILFIGDSNIYLMSQNSNYYNKKYGDKIYWVAESGATVNFIEKDNKIAVGKFMPEYVSNTLTKTKIIDLKAEIKSNKITDIAVLLGTNSLGNDSAKDLSEKLINLSKESVARVYCVSLLPYVDKSKYEINDDDIIKFNSRVKEKLMNSLVKYLDIYTLVKSIKGYKNETEDGLHYNRAIYDKVFDEIMAAIQNK